MITPPKAASLLVAACLVALTPPLVAQTEAALKEAARKEPGRFPGNAYDLTQTFNLAELRRLAAMEERDFDANRRLWMLILHAGLQQEKSILPLLDDKKLRASHSSVDQALSACDYMLNKNEAALDHILACLAIVNGDCDEIIILSVLNEWDRTLKAFRKHFSISVDGAAGANYAGFMSVRHFLYPELYAKHKEAIEVRLR